MSVLEVYQSYQSYTLCYFFPEQGQEVPYSKNKHHSPPPHPSLPPILKFISYVHFIFVCVADHIHGAACQASLLCANGK